MSTCSLYLVSPPRIELGTFLPQAEKALSTGLVKAFQLRLKEAQDAELLEAAREILPLCRAHDVAFILNDRPDLALKCGADGGTSGARRYERGRGAQDCRPRSCDWRHLPCLASSGHGGRRTRGRLCRLRRVLSDNVKAQGKN